mgnify:CR=1 FL=1
MERPTSCTLLLRTNVELCSYRYSSPKTTIHCILFIHSLDPSDTFASIFACRRRGQSAKIVQDS